jgi:SpoIVB peptidase S55
MMKSSFMFCWVAAIALMNWGMAGLSARAAQTPAATQPDGQYMFEDQVEPGMTGYGLTVMHGATIEKFQFSVIDVIKDFQPDMNVILVRCSGLGLEHSGIIAGMSGSPCFINGKMIGAIAYGWGFSKDPIAGVQPIRQMLNIPLPQPESAENAAAVTAESPSQLESDAVESHLAGWSALTSNMFKLQSESNDQSSDTDGAPVGMDQEHRLGLVPLSSPLMVSGASGTVIDYLRTALRGWGMVPLAAGSGAGDAGELGGMAQINPASVHLEPGSGIAVPLLTGDMDMSAIGTVTDVTGNHVYAFGHEFFAQGPNNLPIETTYIYTIIPGYEESFKMGSSFVPQGRLVMDNATGIVGELGKTGTTVPVTIHMQDVDPDHDRVFHYQLYPGPNSTMDALSAALLGSMTSRRTLVTKTSNYTVYITGDIQIGDQTVSINEQAVTGIDQDKTTGDFDPTSTLLPVALLTNNPFQNLPLVSVNLNVFESTIDHSGQILSAAVDRSVVAPGDHINVRVWLKAVDSPVQALDMQLTIPKDTPDGDYDMIVGSAGEAIQQETNYFPQYFNPTDIESLKADINRLLAYRGDRVYAQLVLNAQGVQQDQQPMPNLPLSRIDLLAASQSGNLYPLYNQVQASVAAGAVVQDGGQREFHIQVQRHADARFAEPPAPESGGGPPSAAPDNSDDSNAEGGGGN